VITSGNIGMRESSPLTAPAPWDTSYEARARPGRRRDCEDHQAVYSRVVADAAAKLKSKRRLSHRSLALPLFTPTSSAVLAVRER
jgi:hypothetical protein